MKNQLLITATFLAAFSFAAMDRSHAQSGIFTNVEEAVGSGIQINVAPPEDEAGGGGGDGPPTAGFVINIPGVGQVNVTDGNGGDFQLLLFFFDDSPQAFQGEAEEDGGGGGLGLNFFGSFNQFREQNPALGAENPGIFSNLPISPS